MNGVKKKEKTEMITAGVNASAEEKLSKVRKSCRNIKTIVTIAMAFFTVCIVLCLAGIGVMAVMKDDVNALYIENADNIHIDDKDDIGIFTWRVNVDELRESGNFSGAMMVPIATALLWLIAGLVVLNIIRKMFRDLEQSETPFSTDVLKKLKTLFIVATVWCVLFYGVTMGVVVGFVLRCVYFILDYGCCIQTEIDETL